MECAVIVQLKGYSLQVSTYTTVSSPATGTLQKIMCLTAEKLSLILQLIDCNWKGFWWPMVLGMVWVAPRGMLGWCLQKGEDIVPSLSCVETDQGHLVFCLWWWVWAIHPCWRNLKVSCGANSHYERKLGANFQLEVRKERSQRRMQRQNFPPF